MNSSLVEARDQLRDQYGLEFSRVCRALALLTDIKFVLVDEWVHQSALSHRTVSYLVDRLAPFFERQGDGLRFAPSLRSQATALFASSAVPPDTWESLASQHPTLPRLVEVLAARPQPDRHLDHVAATPLTALKRALFLSRQYDLAQSPALMLGDHDMTAVALALLHPELDLAVVDIDDRLLSYIDELNRTQDTRIRTYFADLRVELPGSLGGQFDLVFTDPPYSESGVGLFLQRAICALKEAEFTRIFLSYGYGERQTSLGYKVQATLSQLRLLSEAILPRFNHYDGAPALGQRSDLYILRPTRRSLPAAQRYLSQPHIYTQGNQAQESDSDASFGPALISAMKHAMTDWEEKRTLIVGPPIEQWPLDHVLSADLAVYFEQLRTAKSNFTKRTQVVINLYPTFPHLVAHTCLTTHADHLLLTAHQRPLADLFAHSTPLSQLIQSVFRLEQRVQDGRLALVELVRRRDIPEDATTLLVRQILQRRRAQLGNAWREALIHTAARNGSQLSKNAARRCIAQTTLGSYHAQSYIGEIPLGALAELPDAATATLEAARNEQI